MELGQRKLDHSEFENFKDFYTKDWQKFMDYNIVDVELVLRLEDKMKLVELAIALAYDAKVNYNDIHYQVRMWDNIILQSPDEEITSLSHLRKPQRKDKSMLVRMSKNLLQACMIGWSVLTSIPVSSPYYAI